MMIDLKKSNVGVEAARKPASLARRMAVLLVGTVAAGLLMGASEHPVLDSVGALVLDVGQGNQAAGAGDGVAGGGDVWDRNADAGDEAGGLVASPVLASALQRVAEGDHPGAAPLPRPQATPMIPALPALPGRPDLAANAAPPAVPLDVPPLPAEPRKACEPEAEIGRVEALIRSARALAFSPMVKRAEDRLASVEQREAWKSEATQALTVALKKAQAEVQRVEAMAAFYAREGLNVAHAQAVRRAEAAIRSAEEALERAGGADALPEKEIRID